MACRQLQRFETVCLLILALLFVLGCDRGHRVQDQRGQALRADAMQRPVLTEHKKPSTTHVFRGSVSALSIQDGLIAR